MNRTNSLLILGAITLSTFLVFNTAITNTLVEVFAASPEPRGGYDEIVEEERSQNYDYSSPMMMNDYYAQGPPPSMMMAEEGKGGEYNPDRYGGYYGHYEGDFYLDQYEDGNPYDGIDGPPYNGNNNNDDDNPYDDDGGSDSPPYIIG
jgi:hypothetical protein